MCSGNGSGFEVFHSNGFWINFYLRLKPKTHILLWNYREYSSNKGSVSFSNIKSDIKKIVDYVENRNDWNKIIFHGISLGGIASTYAYSISNTKNNYFLFADRTFTSINQVVKTFKFGVYLEKLYRVITIGLGDSNNVFNLSQINEVKGSKIIAFDPLDSIIPDEASIKTGMGINSKEFNKLLNEAVVKIKSNQSVVEENKISARTDHCEIVVKNNPEKYDILNTVLQNSAFEALETLSKNITVGFISYIELIIKKLKYMDNKVQDISEHQESSFVDYIENSVINELPVNLKLVNIKSEKEGNKDNKDSKVSDKQEKDQEKNNNSCINDSRNFSRLNQIDIDLNKEVKISDYEFLEKVSS
jgi:hypothetical protein